MKSPLLFLMYFEVRDSEKLGMVNLKKFVIKLTQLLQGHKYNKVWFRAQTDFLQKQ